MRPVLHSMTFLSLHSQEAKVFLHQMKKCLQAKILPLRYFLKAMSVYLWTSSNEPHWVTLEDLIDFACDLYLSKQPSQLLASRLEQWNLVKAAIRITSFRTRNKDFISFFDMESRLCYCKNISGLFTFLGFLHNPSDWRLFIDSSRRGLKAVFLHNRKKYSSIPIAHSVHLKESYANM